MDASRSPILENIPAGECIKTDASAVLSNSDHVGDLFAEQFVPNPSRELEELYCQCSRQMFVCALAITRSPARAEDAVHEAFCRVLKSKSRARDLKAFVFRAVRNAAIDLTGRRRAVHESLPEFIYDPQPHPVMLTEQAEFQQHIAGLFQELGEDERETIVQHLYGELTFREIAAVRDVPLGTVTSWYRRGLDKLRRKVEVADGFV